MDPFVGEVRPAGFNFAPIGWALCEGQILSISQNTALFSLLGTNFGGNGTSNFALPNLQGNVAISAGQGPGLQNYVLGQTGGESTVLLNTTHVPSHSHPVAAQSGAANQTSPIGHFPAKPSKAIYSPSATGIMEPSAVVADGGSQPHNNLQPYLVVNYIIALTGVFPSRN